MATKGGKRAGAGRKPGSVTKKTRAIADGLLAGGGLTPLEFMLEVLRTEPPPDAESRVKAAFFERRFEAAKSAAPYMHAKLSAVTADTKITGGLTLLTEFPQ
jgi:hypothetical protein